MDKMKGGPLSKLLRGAMTQTPFKLSFCIGTYNRGAFIGETLDNIISQATYECEIVVSDNASTDNTEQVVADCSRRFNRLRYLRQETNQGIDRNYNHAVEQARGEYCWLMPDDDLLRPGAVARVLDALRKDPSVIMVNVEIKDFSMSKVLQGRCLNFESDRVYGRGEMDRFFLDIDPTLMYIGNVIIRRSLWLARERARYFDSLFIHVGMIFQERLPSNALVIAEPLISYRLGNTHAYSPTEDKKIADVTSYSPTANEILLAKWPTLVQSLALSVSLKQTMPKIEPWNHPLYLLLLRGWGFYSLAEYRRWVRPRLKSIHRKLFAAIVALIPGVLVNTVFVLYYSTRSDRGHRLGRMKQSRFYLPNWRAFKRA